jgi:hypothetical protein
MRSSSTGLVVFIVVFGSGVPGAQAAEFAVSTNSVVVLSSGAEARQALTAEDDFIRALSDFDRAARMKSETPVSRAQFLKFVEEEVVIWTDSDVSKVERAATNARQKLSRFKLALPARILLVKTTGREEADSAYCRGTNVTVLSRHFVNAPAAELDSILIHELFHILSRNNPELRENLYALIGFKPCAEIEYPPTLERRHIANPDAPRLDYFVEVRRGEEKLDVVPVLFATPERWNKEKGGEFFAYFTWRLMAIEGGKSSPVLNANGHPVLLSSREVSGFREQIGEQPGPILQSEEILAEYFVRFAEGHGRIPAAVQEGMRKLLMQR